MKPYFGNRERKEKTEIRINERLVRQINGWSKYTLSLKNQSIKTKSVDVYDVVAMTTLVLLGD